MRARPYEPRDLPAIHALFSQPQVAPFVGRTPFDAIDVTRVDLERLAPHRMVAEQDGIVAAYGDLNRPATARANHLAHLRVVGGFASGGVGPSSLIAALVELADRWLGLAKIEAEVDVDDPVIPHLIAAGFAHEVRKRSARRRGRALVDAVVLGRLRPGFVPMTDVRAPPAWPAPGEPVSVQIRHVTREDVPEWAALHRARSVVWGTLQLPVTMDALWRERVERNVVIGQHALVALHKGRIVGSGGVHRSAFPSEHAAVIGMGVHEDFQGRRVGGQVLDALVTLARDWLGLHRIELEVYPDNPRAVALYRSRGFVDEGIRRYNCVRDGAHVDSLAMAITPDTGRSPRPVGP